MSLDLAKQRILTLISNYLLPGLNCEISSPCFALELFPLLTTFDSTTRNNIYFTSFTSLMLSNTYFCKQFLKIKKDQNIIFNTLAKENKKQYFKRVGKLSHNHPFYLFYWVARRMMRGDYESMILEVVNILINCTRLALDTFVFIIIYFMLNNPEPAVNTETAEVSIWYRNCYNFLCVFYRKHFDTDLTPLFRYILNKLKRTIKEVEFQDYEGEVPAVELKILKELISKMSGVVFLDNMDRDHLLTLAGGPRLQLELNSPVTEVKAAKKSKTELEVYLFKKSAPFEGHSSLAFYLLMLIAQKRSEFFSKSSICNIQIFASIYDEYTSSFMQLLKVLTFQSSDNLQFSRLLPDNSLKEMLITYKYLPAHVESPSSWLSRSPGMPPKVYVSLLRRSGSSWRQMSRTRWRNTSMGWM